MESILFKIEQNNDDIKKTILTNIMKMLTERKLLDIDQLNSNIQKIINGISDDNFYTIELVNKKKYNIKIINQKITAVSKQSNIAEFLEKFSNHHNILVIKEANTKVLQTINSDYPETEVFTEPELMINLVDNRDVPKHEVIEKDSPEYKQFFITYLVTKRQMPLIYANDMAARYYNMKKGDVCRITRPSKNAGYVISYRLTV